jgi:hypothetical protein
VRELGLGKSSDRFLHAAAVAFRELLGDMVPQKLKRSPLLVTAGFFDEHGEAIHLAANVACV